MNATTKIVLRLFSLIFYLVGGCFLVVVAWNYYYNHGLPGWMETWTDWLFKGLILLFLGFFCRFLEDVQNIIKSGQESPPDSHK